MPLNKVKPGSDMYQFLNDYPHENANRGYTWNTVKGQCPHLCEYCFMRRFKLNPRRFDNSELKTDLGKENFIFVGSSNDMFSASVPSEWIQATLNHCRKYPENQYLFQSKNPIRFFDFQTKFPTHSLLCTTIESNREFPEISKAPSSKFERAECIRELRLRGFETQITIEPILDFDLDDFLDLLIDANPTYLVIGANSKGHGLPEPPWEKVEQLIKTLSQYFKVIQKNNLERLKRRC